jgi:hypothetical protein
VPPFNQSTATLSSQRNKFDDPLSQFSLSETPLHNVSVDPQKTTDNVDKQSLLEYLESLVLGKPDYKGFQIVQTLAMSFKMAICMVVGWNLVLGCLMCVAGQYYGVIYFATPILCAYIALGALVKRALAFCELFPVWHT